MNLYLLTQTTNTGYDTFDSCVVQAESKDKARLIHPSGQPPRDESNLEYYRSGWVKPNLVTVTYLGQATPSLNLPIIICSSFNAG